jgi:hypothetical protein
LEAATVNASEHTTLSETELLVLTRRSLPVSLRRRYDYQIARRDAETLTAAEHQELLQLTDQVELHNVERLEHLSALARMRGVSLTQLMQDLGIEPPATHD